MGRRALDENNMLICSSSYFLQYRAHRTTGDLAGEETFAGHRRRRLRMFITCTWAPQGDHAVTDRPSGAYHRSAG